LENLEMSQNLTAVSEMSGGVPRTIREVAGNFTLSGEWSPWTSGGNNLMI